MSRIQLARNEPHVEIPPFVRKRRASRQHSEFSIMGKGSDEVLGDAVGEILLLGVPSKILEWQDGDRRQASRKRAEIRLPRHVCRSRLPHPHHAGDAFELLKTGVLEVDRANQSIPHGFTHRDSPRIGDRLESCGNVHTVAEDVVRLVDDDIGEIDPDSERHAT